MAEERLWLQIHHLVGEAAVLVDSYAIDSKDIKRVPLFDFIPLVASELSRVATLLRSKTRLIKVSILALLGHDQIVLELIYFLGQLGLFCLELLLHLLD